MIFSAFFMLYIYPPTLKKKRIHFPSCHKSPFKWHLQSISKFSKNMSKLLHQLWSRNPKLEKHSSTDGSWCRIFPFKRKPTKCTFATASGTKVSSPINSGIINDLKSRRRAFFRENIKTWSKQQLSCEPWEVSSHQDERQHRQDVVGGVSEEGPPRQGDSLPRQSQNVSVSSVSSRWWPFIKSFPLPVLQRSHWGRWWPGCWRRPSRRWCRLRRLLWWWTLLSEGWKGDSRCIQRSTILLQNKQMTETLHNNLRTKDNLLNLL